MAVYHDQWDLWRAYAAGYRAAYPEASEEIAWIAYGQWLADQLAQIEEEALVD